MSDQINTRSPIEGVEIWRNPKNKFVIFQLHYTANPKKRDPAYIEAIRSKMPHAQFMMEYEDSWDSYSGLPVYQDFDKKRHVTKEKPQPEIGLPLLRGWDFGLTPACVIAQLQGDTLVVIKEFVELNMGVDKFSDMVLHQCRTLWPEWGDLKRNWRDFIDPSGEFRKDTDEGSCALVLDSKGLTCFPGPVAFTERKKAVEQFLVRQTKSGPAFQIDQNECPTLVRGFIGGYRYPEKSAEVEPNKIRPLKDEHSHPHDALQYIASRIMMTRNATKRSVPRLSYGQEIRT